MKIELTGTDRSKPGTSLARYLLVCAALALSAITLLVDRYFPPYAVVSGELIEHSPFSAPQEWEWRGIEAQTDGPLLLYREPQARVPAVLHDLRRPRDIFNLQFRIEAATRDVVPGELAGSRARCDLYARDANETQYRWFAPAIKLAGTHDRQIYQGVITLPEQAVRLRIECEMAGTSGQFEVFDISLRSLRQRMDYQAAVAGVALAWLVLGLAVAFRLVQAGRHTALYVAVPGVLLALVPNTLRLEIYASLGLPVPGWPVDHLMLFLVLGIVVARLNGRSREMFLFLLLCLCALGLSFEAIQLFLPSRTPEFADIVANALGGAIGLAIGYLRLRTGPPLRGS